MAPCSDSEMGMMVRSIVRTHSDSSKEAANDPRDSRVAFGSRRAASAGLRIYVRGVRKLCATLSSAWRASTLDFPGV